MVNKKKCPNCNSSKTTFNGKLFHCQKCDYTNNNYNSGEPVPYEYKHEEGKRIPVENERQTHNKIFQKDILCSVEDTRIFDAIYQEILFVMIKTANDLRKKKTDQDYRDGVSDLSESFQFNMDNLFRLIDERHSFLMEGGNPI